MLEVKMPKVLIADKMSEKAKEIFVEKGLDVDVKTGLTCGTCNCQMMPAWCQ